MELLLCQLDSLRGFARDEDIGGVATSSRGRAIAIDRREHGWEVNRGSGRGFDKLDVLAMTSTDELLYRHVKLRDIDNPSQLHPIMLAHNRSVCR